MTDFTLPTITDFASETETLVHLVDTKVDDQGRQLFAAMWIDQGRVQGQVFRTDLTAFTRREELDKRSVRVLS